MMLAVPAIRAFTTNLVSAFVFKGIGASETRTLTSYLFLACPIVASKGRTR